MATPKPKPEPGEIAGYVFGLLIAIGVMALAAVYLAGGFNAEKPQPLTAEQIAVSNKLNATVMCEQRHRRETQAEATYGPTRAVDNDGKVDVHIGARIGITDASAVCTVREGKIVGYVYRSR